MTKIFLFFPLLYHLKALKKKKILTLSDGSYMIPHTTFFFIPLDRFLFFLLSLRSSQWLEVGGTSSEKGDVTYLLSTNQDSATFESDSDNYWVVWSLSIKRNQTTSTLF